MSNQYKDEINMKFKLYFSEINGFKYRLDHFLDVIESCRGLEIDRPEVIMKWIPFLYELKDKYIKYSKRHLELLTGLESEWNKEKIVRGELSTGLDKSLLDGLFQHFWSNRDYRIKELLNVKEVV